MSAQAGTHQEQPVDSLRADRITYGAVHLEIGDLDRSLAFWRDLIGLGEVRSGPGETQLGFDGRPLVVLHPGATRPAGRGHAGLYHLAIHVPDSREFARALVRVGQAGVPQSPTDHVFSKATYLNDPDGILLEITLETPERFGSVELVSGMPQFIDSDGRRRGGTEPLDVAEAIAPLDGGDAGGAMSSGSYIGHVHLHVPDLRAANDFYRDVVGFEDHAFMAGIGMADLSAGGRFPHRLAANNWHGPNAVQPAPGTAGMRNFELILRDSGELERMAARAAASGQAQRDLDGQAVVIHDPAGNEIVITESRA